mmetsp:Transcript_19255/g.32136  ORF Transcript_19255/g.32136 Transcript_19255/m.32136 type:complete len:150 (+) Transcript_19255:1881-2330(+)
MRALSQHRLIQIHQLAANRTNKLFIMASFGHNLPCKPHLQTPNEQPPVHKQPTSSTAPTDLKPRPTLPIQAYASPNPNPAQCNANGDMPNSPTKFWGFSIIVGHLRGVDTRCDASTANQGRSSAIRPILPTQQTPLQRLSTPQGVDQFR